jgi:hypothetical protein
MSKIYISNGEVAWEVPGGRTARMYRNGLYLPPAGWKVLTWLSPKKWRLCAAGEMRRVEEPVAATIS